MSPFTKTMYLLRLDYISCILNSALICVIAVDTSQFGFIPASVFCLALYSYNIREWNKISHPPNQQA